MKLKEGFWGLKDGWKDNKRTGCLKWNIRHY